MLKTLHKRTLFSQANSSLVGILITITDIFIISSAQGPDLFRFTHLISGRKSATFSVKITSSLHKKSFKAGYELEATTAYTYKGYFKFSCNVLLRNEAV